MGKDGNGDSGDDLALRLQEFGLGTYETKAYLALLSRGPLSVSELAYHAAIPRTKTYGTLNKLAKKGLARITHDKPVIYSPTSPEEAFGDVLLEQEKRIKGMRNALENLHRISSEGRRPKGAEGQTYLVLDPDSVPGVLCELISTARSSIASAMDSWGARLFSQCREPIKKAVAKNLDLKLLMYGEHAEKNLLPSLPDGVNVRIGDEGVNIFIFDKATIMMVNGSDGKGVLFRSTDVLAGICNNLFYSMWNRGRENAATEESMETRTPGFKAKTVKVVAKERSAL